VNHDDLARSSDRNILDYQRHVTLTARGGALVDEDGLLLFAGAHNYPGTFTNGAMRTNDTMPGEEVLARARAFFGPRRRGFALWVRDHADADLDEVARAAGLWPRPPAEGNAGIAIDRPPPDGWRSRELDIRPVDDDQGRREYLRIVGTVYDMAGATTELVEAVMFSLDSLLAENVTVFLGYHDGVPMSGCMVFVTGDVAGLYWAATLPEARGRGLATACFLASWEAGFRAGATRAVGMASGKGTPLWLKQGFEVVTRYRRYVARPGGT
jgi:GNAT superfamily N-acetyltransferase